MDISRYLLVTGTGSFSELGFILQVFDVACNEWCGVVRISQRIPTHSVLVCMHLNHYITLTSLIAVCTDG